MRDRNSRIFSGMGSDNVNAELIEDIRKLFYELILHKPLMYTNS